MVVRFCPKIISSVRAEDDASGTSFNLTRVMVFPGADLERKRLVKVNAAWALVPDDKVSPGRPYHPASDQEYCGYRARHLRDLTADKHKAGRPGNTDRRPSECRFYTPPPAGRTGVSAVDAGAAVNG